MWELRGREAGPRGEILTPATMGGEQRRATVREIMYENGREREMGLTLVQGLKRGRESVRIEEKGGQRERKEGDN